MIVGDRGGKGKKVWAKYLLGIPLGGRFSMVGVPTLSLEQEVSLIYMFLPKNTLEHSVSFHPVLSPSISFQHVPRCDLHWICDIPSPSGTFHSLPEPFTNILDCSEFSHYEFHHSARILVNFLPLGLRLLI